MTLLLIGGVVLLALAAVFRSVLTALLVQEVKGALADRLRRDVEAAASLLPDKEQRAQMHAEWLGELGAASDRPLKAVVMVRGFTVAARKIAADTVPVPVADSGPTFVDRVQQTAIGRAARLVERVGQVDDLEDYTLSIIAALLLIVGLGIISLVLVSVGPGAYAVVVFSSIVRMWFVSPRHRRRRP